MNRKRIKVVGIFIACLVLSGYLTKASAQFAMGVDVSWLPRLEANGVKYYDQSGKQGDCLAIMKDLGINAVRLRTWINPSMTNDQGGHCSQKETIQMAQRCKKLGMRVMVDFHYNNTWVSVGKPATPKEWATMTYTQMQQALYDYAYGFCKEMKDSGVTPAWFQNGNETNSGLCPPTGSLSTNPVQMTGLFNKGYAAIHAIFPLPNTKVLIHVAQPQNTAGAAMVRTYIKNGGQLDALGWSSYAGSGNVDGIVTNVKTWHDEFKLETYAVEIGSSESADKQQTLIQKWNAGIEAMNNPCEGGTFYWEPEGMSGSMNWSCHIFDASGKATAAWNAYKTPLTKVCTKSGLQMSTAKENVPRIAQCYSNPSARTISIKGNGQFRYFLYGLNGHKIACGYALNAVSAGSELKAGVYLVRIMNSESDQMIKVSVY